MTEKVEMTKHETKGLGTRNRNGRLRALEGGDGGIPTLPSVESRRVRTPADQKESSTPSSLRSPLSLTPIRQTSLSHTPRRRVEGRVYELVNELAPTWRLWMCVTVVVSTLVWVSNMNLMNMGRGTVRPLDLAVAGPSNAVVLPLEGSSGRENA